MEAIIWIVAAIAIYQIIKILRKRQKANFLGANLTRRPHLNERELDMLLRKGALYSALAQYGEALGFDDRTPSAIRMSKFLTFGMHAALQAAQIETPIDKLGPGPESAAVVMVVQQGIHPLLTLDLGQDPSHAEEYRHRGAEILGMTFGVLFHIDPDNQDKRSVEPVEVGTSVTRMAQAEQAPILQRAFDAWDNLLREMSEENIEAMGRVMRDVSASCRGRWVWLRDKQDRRRRWPGCLPISQMCPPGCTESLK